MYLRFATVVALLSAPLLVLAQNPNPFKIPSSGWQVTAGEPIELDWTPTTGGTISLVLRSGAMSDLNEGVTIASSIANDGSYTWTPDANLPRRSDYTIEIIDDQDTSQTNYSPPFIVESTNVIQSTTITSASASSTTGTETESSETGSTETAATGTASSSGMMTITGSSSSRETGTRGGSQTSNGASFQGQPSSSSPNSAARATAMAGVLGAVAFGALAL